MGVVTTEQTTQPVQAASHKIAKKAKKKQHKKKRLKKQIKIDRQKKHHRVKKQIKASKLRIPVATIYVGTSNAEDRQATEAALAAWNQTGAVKFIQVAKPQQAYIYLHDGNYGQTTWAGEEIERRVTKNTRSSEFRLNDFYMRIIDPQSRIDVAEHELGHAIGLNHIDGRPSVMNSVLDLGHAYSIQPIDVVSVITLYNTQR